MFPFKYHVGLKTWNDIFLVLESIWVILGVCI